MLDASNCAPLLMCTVADVYRCWCLVLFWALFVAMSGFFKAVSWWRHSVLCKVQCIVIVQSFLKLLKLHKLAVKKFDLSRRGLTWCHCVLDHGLNLRWNILMHVTGSDSELSELDLPQNWNFSHGTEDELRSLTSRGKKLPCSLVVWHWNKDYFVSSTSYYSY